MTISRLLGSRLVRSTGIYTFAGVVNGLVVFLLMPVYTRALDREAVGLLAMFTTLAGFITPFVSFHASVVRRYYDKERIDIDEYVSHCLLVIVANTGIVGGVVWVFCGYISVLTDFPSGWLWAVVLFSLCTALMRVVLSLWQVRIKPLQYGAFQVSQSLVAIVAAILFVVVFQYGWRGGIIAATASATIFGALAVALLSKMGCVAWSCNVAHIKDIFAYNTPLVFHALGRTVMTMCDKIFITRMVGLAATGLYAPGYQIGMVMFVVSSAFNNAWVPHLFDKLKLGDEREKLHIVKLTYIYFAALMAAALCLGMLAPWFTSFFLGTQFADSAQYVIWVALGYAFNGMYWMQSNYILYAGKTHLIAVVTLVSVALNLVLTYVLIKANGAVGAAQAAAVVFLFVFVATWIVAAKVYSMPWLLGYSVNGKRCDK